MMEARNARQQSTLSRDSVERTSPKPEHIYPAPKARVFSSLPAGWRGIVVEEYHFPAFEVPEIEMREHILNLQLGPALAVEWQQKGRLHTMHMAPGEFCLFPSGPHARACWHDRLDLLAIALDPAFVSGVAYESASVRAADLSLPDLAAAVSLSPARFTRLFKG
jgi:hypothetical protein